MVGAESRVLRAVSSLDILSTIFSLAKLSEAQRTACEQIEAAYAEAFVRYAYRECKSSPVGSEALSALLTRVESSEMSLSQWICQIVTVYRWVERHQLAAALIDVMDYVACACEGSSFQEGHSIEWYLEQYGFERAVGR